MKLIFDDVPDELAEKITKNIEVALNEYKKKQIWPQKGDIYHYVSACGETNSTAFSAVAFDNGCLSYGNCFKTKEEAEFKAEQLKVLHELEQLADDKQEWDGKSLHYIIYYSHVQNIIACEGWVDNQYLFNNYYFRSEKSALAAIDEIGEDRLKKYYFGVSE